jgi:hypothetical protein
VIAGVDIGRTRDYTALVVMDLDDVVGIHRLRLGQDWKGIVRGIEALVAPCSLVVVDSTGVGSPIAESLSERLPGRVFPFTFTQSSKPRLIGGLVSAINGRNVRISPQPGADDLKEELGRFMAVSTRTGWKFSGKASGKDDLVMAFALAIFGRDVRRSQ